MDATSEAVFPEVSLGATQTLDLCFDYELALVVRAKFPAHIEGFLAIKCNCATGNGDHVLVDKLGGLVFVQSQVPLWKLEELQVALGLLLAIERPNAS